MRKMKVSPLLPLLKFPLLVQIEIIKTMEPSEQYFLSKCSKRSRGAVKISIPKKQNPEIWIHPISPSVYFYLKISGARFYLFKSYFRDFNRTHEYLSDLFSAPSEVYLEADGTRAEKFLDETFVEAGSVKKSILTRTTEPMHPIINQFSELHPNQDFILLGGTYATEMVREFTWTFEMQSDHKFFGAKNLLLSCHSGLGARYILQPFQGEHLLLEGDVIYTSIFEEFVDKWMKRKTDKLKTAILARSRVNKLTGEFKFEKFSGRNQHYQYNSIIKEYHKFPDGLFNISNGWEVRRATDGKVATIKETTDYLMFLVW